MNPFGPTPVNTNLVWPSGFTPEYMPFEPPQFVPQPLPSDMTGVQLLNALERQTAFIEGDPGAQDLELYYYRIVRIHRSCKDCY